MKFAMYIIYLPDGTVEGTNDVDVAQPFVENDDYVVLHAQHGVYFLGDRNEQEVHEVPV